MIKPFLILLSAWLCMSCSPQAAQTPHPLITAYSDAYNAKDLDAMAALMHPDIEWLSVKGNEIIVEVSGKAALSEAMTSFFKDPNMATGSHRDWSINGNHVAVTEIASWTDKTGQPKSQSALTVYQFDDGLIRRVYYYPAQ